MTVEATATERLRRALTWAIEEGKQVPGVISTEDLRGVADALAADAPFAPALYPTLRLFTQILWRIELPPTVPRASLADALEAIGERASWQPPWSFVTSVEPHAFRALGFDASAAGIDRARARHREGWRLHGERSRRFIRDAFDDVGGGRVAWVFGAGRAYDLPLGALGRRFEKVVLVDVDGAALEETLRSLDGALRPRFELVAADLTGIAAAWRAGADEAIAGARDDDDAAARLEELYGGYRVAADGPWRFLGARGDLVVSQMVLSQLNGFLEWYPRRLYEERFGAPLFERHPALRAANMLFAHRVQHDHLRFLARHADAAVLTSDVAEQYERLVPGGAVEPVGEEMPLLGAYRLAERVPRGLRVVRQQDWSWQRAIPRADAPRGSRLRVTALLLLNS
jgi:hypothetical protein